MSRKMVEKVRLSLFNSRVASCSLFSVPPAPPQLLIYARTILCRLVVKDLAKSLAKNKKLAGRQLRDADIEIE